MKLSELELDDAAKQAAGNWRRFNTFVWFRRSELDDADNWAVIYTHNRDSGLLELSNATVIAKAMMLFTGSDDPDVVFESHSHWAVGHFNGFSVRVFREGDITEAFKAYHELDQRMDDYPILDESDYSEREFEATLDNIKDAAWRLKNDFDLPAGWEAEAYGWLSDNRCGEIESTDDQGGYPSEAALSEAFDALGFEPNGKTATA